MNIPVPLGMIWPFSSTGGYEWLIVLAVAVLLFGKRLPELGRLIGRTLVNFRHGVSEMKDEISRATDEPGHTGRDTDPEPPVTPSPPTSQPDPVIPTTDPTPDTQPPTQPSKES